LAVLHLRFRCRDVGLGSGEPLPDLPLAGLGLRQAALDLVEPPLLLLDDRGVH